jgi:hypothetical protein
LGIKSFSRDWREEVERLRALPTGYNE